MQPYNDKQQFGMLPKISNCGFKNFDYTKRFLSFTIFMTLLLSLKTTFFFILFFKMPEIEFIIFQIFITLIFYPLLFLFFNPVSKLINLIVRV